MTFRRSPALPALLAALSIAAPAQTPKPDYTRESSLFEHLDRIYRYAPDGTGSKEISGVIAVHDQAGVKSLSVISFPFASSAEHVEIDYVRVRRPDGTLIPTPATDAQELPDPVTREAPFYSDLKQEQIPIRSLREGDHLEYKLRIVRTKPEAPNHFWGTESFFTVSSGFVVLSETLELHLPKSTNAQVWSPTYKPVVTETPTESVYHWETSQPIPTAGKKHNDLLRLEKDPHFADQTGPRLPPIAWTSFHSWQEVGAWYRSMEASRADPDDDIRARVKELTAGKSTPEEKTRAIYAYVSSQVRYIGVAFGIGRYQPHAAGEVLSNQYGDCKDKTTLLISMLAAANIPADAVLIGAGVAFNEAVPSPASFNHAINLVHVDNQPVWLDATAEVAPYRLLNFEIRDHKALVIPLTGEAHIETTPKDPPFPNIERFTATGTLDDQGTSHSSITLEDRGDTEVVFRSVVRSVSPAQWDELMQRISQSMGYSGKVTNAQFSRPDATAEPFHITYDYEREKNGDWDNHRILPQLPPIGLTDVDEKDPPASPIELGIPLLQTSHATMKLPPNWSAELPAAIHLKTSFATFDKTYAFKDGTLTTDRRFEVLEKEIPAKDWPVYHKWYKDAGLEGETYIQLIPASNSGITTPQRIVIQDNNNPAAADLIRQAIQATKLKDWATAKKHLDEAKALNPKQPYLWSEYAFVASSTGNPDEGIKDYRKEVALHPNESTIYLYLSQLCTKQKKTDEAIAVLRSGLDLNPSDSSNVLYLESLLTSQPDLQAAEKVLRTGLLASPTNAIIKMRLGINLLHQHKQDEGEPILRDLLNTSEDPFPLNDAAYELANDSLDIPLAEKAASHSLELLDKLSTNGETGLPARRRANLLPAVWDTYGWILYRQNKLSDAEPWIRAGWRNGSSAECGYHLAVILQDQHHPDEALTQLRLSLAGKNASDEIKHLIYTMIDKLQAAGASNSTKDAALELQMQRTYEFPRGTFKPTGDSYATIELDVSNQGTTAIRFVQGDQSFEALFDTLRTLKLDLQIPSASHASLLRRGVVSCHTQPTCQLVLIPPIDAVRQP